jgi:hypothetical protein
LPADIRTPGEFVLGEAARAPPVTNEHAELRDSCNSRLTHEPHCRRLATKGQQFVVEWRHSLLAFRIALS